VLVYYSFGIPIHIFTYRLEPLEKFFRDRSFRRKLVFMIGEFVPNAVPTHHHHRHHSKHRRKKSTSSGTGSKSSLSGIGSKSTLSGIGGSSNARTGRNVNKGCFCLHHLRYLYGKQRYRVGIRKSIQRSP